VKVFNSSVEKRVEKTSGEVKSLALCGACADCTILVQFFRENKTFGGTPPHRGAGNYF
jgi:hypothetical protein